MRGFYPGSTYNDSWSMTAVSVDDQSAESRTPFCAEHLAHAESSLSQDPNFGRIGTRETEPASKGASA